jgi:hydrogenase maturation factor
MLGLDPLYVANEGKLVAFVPRDRQTRCWQGCEHTR